MLAAFKLACKSPEAAGIKKMKWKDLTYSDITFPSPMQPPWQTAVHVHVWLAAAVKKLAATGAKCYRNKGSLVATAQTGHLTSEAALSSVRYFLLLIQARISWRDAAYLWNSKKETYLLDVSFIMQLCFTQTKQQTNQRLAQQDGPSQRVISHGMQNNSDCRVSSLPANHQCLPGWQMVYSRLFKTLFLTSPHYIFFFQ